MISSASAFEMNFTDLTSGIFAADRVRQIFSSCACVAAFPHESSVQK